MRKSPAPTDVSPDSFPAARRDDWAMLLIGLAAMAVVAARVVLTSITHDEALTYTFHVTAPWADIIGLRSPGPPDNNHLLFTLLAKLSVGLFGNREWALRLPSVLAFAVYALAMAATLRRQVRGVWLWLFLAAALANPAVLEMMSIARGYGLGMAGAMAGVWCLLRGRTARGALRATWWTAATACLAAATLAHLTFVLFLASGLAVIAVSELVTGRPSPRTVCLALVGPLLVCVAVLPVLGHQAAVLGRLDLLGTEGLVSFHVNTVGETVAYSLGGQPASPVLVALLAASAYVVPAAACLAMVSPAMRRGDLPILLAMLLGVSLLSVLQHHVAGIAYLSGRRAVPLFALFILVCGGLAAADGTLAGRLLQPPLAVLGMMLLVCFAAGINLDQTVTWRYDADTRDMMADLRPLLAARAGQPPARLGITWIFEPAINYYRVRDDVAGLAPVDRAGPLGRYDYYFVQTTPATVGGPDLEALQRAAGRLRIIRRYPRSNAVLAAPDPR